MPDNAPGKMKESSKRCRTIRIRGNRTRLPIPVLSEDNHKALSAIAVGVFGYANEGYVLQCRVHHRVQSDLGIPGKPLNQKLTAWWKLDFAGLRGELKMVVKSDIPVSERDEWESWFAAQRAEHERLTGKIIRLETELNARVYELFGLTPEEIALVEESTKYRYGEV